MKIAKRDLKNIEVDVNEDGGFTVWILEKKKVKGKMKTMRHWIVDGSSIKEDGEIRLGSNDVWKINAKYSEKDNSINVTRD
tara:strand:+ start:91 stop:333 length:243 start_codon:yes stop_codon:yes gene_type:complete